MISKTLPIRKIVDNVIQPDFGKTVTIKNLSGILIVTAVETPVNSGQYIATFNPINHFGYWYIDDTIQPAQSNNSPFWLGSYDSTSANIINTVNLTANIGRIITLDSQNSNIANISFTALTGNSAQFNTLLTSPSSSLQSISATVIRFPDGTQMITVGSLTNLNAVSITATQGKFNSLTANSLSSAAITSNVGNIFSLSSINANLANVISTSITSDNILSINLTGSNFISQIANIANLTITSLTGNSFKSDSLTSDIIKVNSLTGNSLKSNAITSLSASFNSLTSQYGANLAQLGGNVGVGINYLPTRTLMIKDAGQISNEIYNSGIFGDGFILDFNNTIPGRSYLELDDMRIRGSLRAHIFQKDIVRVANGFLLISDGTINLYPITPSHTSITAKEAVFRTADVIWGKEIFDSSGLSAGTLDIKSEYMCIQNNGTFNATASGYIYNVQRAYKVGTAQAFNGETTFVRISSSANVIGRTGFVLIDASSEASPFIDVYDSFNSNNLASTASPFTNNSATASTLKVRLGALRGATSPTWGALPNTYGLYARDSWLEGIIVATGGFIGTPSGGWAISADSICAINQRIVIASTRPRITLSHDGLVSKYGDAGGIYFGTDAIATSASFINSNNTRFIKWDGDKFTWAAQNAQLDANGNLTLSGSITAYTGKIGGFTIGTNALSSGNFSINSIDRSLSTSVIAGQKIVIDGANNALNFFDSNNRNVIRMTGNQTVTGTIYNVPGLEMSSSAGDAAGIMLTVWNNAASQDFNPVAAFNNMGAINGPAQAVGIYKSNTQANAADQIGLLLENNSKGVVYGIISNSIANDNIHNTYAIRATGTNQNQSTISGSNHGLYALASHGINSYAVRAYAAGAQNNYSFYGESGSGYFVDPVGIRIAPTSAALTVAGQVWSQQGGFKFPDGSIQTIAGGGGNLFTILPVVSGGTNASSYAANNKFLQFDGTRIVSTIYDQSSFPAAIPTDKYNVSTSTQNYIVKYASSSALTNSNISDDNTLVYIIKPTRFYDGTSYLTIGNKANQWRIQKDDAANKISMLDSNDGEAPLSVGSITAHQVGYTNIFLGKIALNATKATHELFVNGSISSLSSNNQYSNIADDGISFVRVCKNLTPRIIFKYNDSKKKIALDNDSGQFRLFHSDNDDASAGTVLFRANGQDEIVTIPTLSANAITFYDGTIQTTKPTNGNLFNILPILSGGTNATTYDINNKFLQFDGTRIVSTQYDQNSFSKGVGATISGGGTQNYIAKFYSVSGIQNSLIQDDGSGIGINSAPLAGAKLYVYNGPIVAHDGYHTLAIGEKLNTWRLKNDPNAFRLIFLDVNDGYAPIALGSLTAHQSGQFNMFLGKTAIGTLNPPTHSLFVNGTLSANTITTLSASIQSLSAAVIRFNDGTTQITKPINANQFSILPVISGGTNASSYAANNKFLIFDGTRHVSSIYDQNSFAPIDQTPIPIHSALTNYIPKYDGLTSLAVSNVYDEGTYIYLYKPLFVNDGLNLLTIGNYANQWRIQKANGVAEIAVLDNNDGYANFKAGGLTAEQYDIKIATSGKGLRFPDGTRQTTAAAAVTASPVYQKTYYVSPSFSLCAQPYSHTVSGAISGAAVNSIVIVYPGVYNEHITLKDQVNLFCYPGVELRNNTAGAQYGGNATVISDLGPGSTSAVHCTIYGSANIIKYDAGGVVNEACAIGIFNPGSNIKIYANYIESNSWSAFGVLAQGASEAQSPSASLYCDRIVDINHIAVDCDNAYQYVEARQIQSSGWATIYAMVTGGVTQGNNAYQVVRAKEYIKNTGSGIGVYNYGYPVNGACTQEIYGNIIVYGSTCTLNLGGTQRLNDGLYKTLWNSSAGHVISINDNSTWCKSILKNVTLVATHASANSIYSNIASTNAWIHGYAATNRNKNANVTINTGALQVDTTVE